MKLILAQPATPRFLWELEVLLTNVKEFTDSDVILLFAEDDFTIPIILRDKYGCGVFVYSNRHEEYLPATRPWLLSQYFKENPEGLDETYFYIDSDIIFREWPHFATLGFSANKVIGSTCDKYIGYDYIVGCRQGEQIAAKMAEICGITVEQMKGVPGIGAHVLFSDLDSAFWERAYQDSRDIHQYLVGLDSDIQAWTAEMWAQLWGWVREGRTVIAHDELNFKLPTDDIECWEDAKILHNAGVTVNKSYELFFKGAYDKTSPFGKDFSYVRADKLSKKYVEAIEKVVT